MFCALNSDERFEFGYHDISSYSFALSMTYNFDEIFLAACYSSWLNPNIVNLVVEI